MPTSQDTPTPARSAFSRFTGMFRPRNALATRPPETEVLAGIFKEIRRMSDSFDAEMSQLRADVAAQSSVIASATAAFRGLAAQLEAAVASAVTAGATPDQVAALVSLRTSLESNTASLANAIPANTPPSTSASQAAPSPATPAATQG